jgi:hypothetical protein
LQKQLKKRESQLESLKKKASEKSQDSIENADNVQVFCIHKNENIFIFSVCFFKLTFFFK